MIDSSTGPISSISKRRRILFFAEAVTLAHVARPVALAKNLNPALYEVHFACDARYHKLLGKLPFIWHPIHSLASEKFLEALSKGSPVYRADTLRAYVNEDAKVIKEVSPDVIVGDFRLSLAVSAPLAQIPYMTIANAYWSPYAKRRFPVPDIPLAKIIGIKAAQYLFNAIQPLAFAYHALPLNKIRHEYGLPKISLDLRHIYTYADHTLYADIPALAPTIDLPSGHHYLGPVLWSPAVPLPAWWEKIPADKPVLYVSLGSSGQSQLLPEMLKALADLPITLLVATAGRIKLPSPPKNAFIADYLPGDKATARASLVICNGGSLMTQQALIKRVPVLGIVNNLDQHLNMEAVQSAGAGELRRAANVTTAHILATTRQMLDQPRYAQAATRLADLLSNYNASDKFNSILGRMFSRKLCAKSVSAR
ncbi:putative glycosyl transferase [Nitrosococcus oceani ATCC 19707]|uniref:Glycosyl transferase n=2 Tax=Nitrosococcus oceani TaxID=1229 RepID=Q3J9P6_NITOC|nr:glycosyltransferase [Nitrosococcus oceani]ABA58450.1 putative glycosyl transferase [Nitrosococcus oceani ATCC 19707]EDZ67335.1 hypothetical protein NOC27_662 [Nitrosococcus oceani AFC27]KFI19052.1 glycosyl transferase family 1 [Nitrosococcus oceani C-27]GEM18845.1 hypothetical protein NONS58_02070 [Nitrosococcus oceani]